MIYRRYLNLPELLNKKSILLLGPRQTGKSTLTQTSPPEATYINLAASDVYRELSARPKLIRQQLSPQTRKLIIDEAQRIPEIFDEVQVLIDNNKELRVILTGSSARKLKRTGINLLPGRIWQERLFPLVHAELGPGRTAE
jgi:predicted AAA+ superfamily ATPase